jgi:hypothetical protein
MLSKHFGNRQLQPGDVIRSKSNWFKFRPGSVATIIKINKCSRDGFWGFDAYILSNGEFFRIRSFHKWYEVADLIEA